MLYGGNAQGTQTSTQHTNEQRWILHQPCLEACPPLTAAACRRAGIHPGRGDVAEAVTATVAHSGTPPLAKGAFTAEKRPQAEKGPLLAGSQPQV